jgi:ferric-dicitrate binding protein FerR (iron transport regulator)
MTSRVPRRRSRHVRSIWLSLSLATVVAGCEVVTSQPGTVSPPPTRGPSGPARLGTVTATAAQVSVNTRPVSGTVALNDGDKVATDATGRAHIDLPGRGTVDLEANTDPYFIREGACVLVRILFGGALVSGSSLCVEDDQGTRVALNSAIHVSVARGRTSITVLEGTVHLQRIARVPTQETLTQFHRITVTGGVQQRVIVPQTEVDGIRRRILLPAQPMRPVQPPPPMIR